MKLIDFLYVHDYSFRKLIVLLYKFWHGQTILVPFLSMLWSFQYPIPGNFVNFRCGYLVKKNWPNFLSTWYTEILNTGFVVHVAIFWLSHTWKSCQLSFWLSCKEKLTNLRIDQIHRDFNYMLVVVTYLQSFPCPDPDPLSITWKASVIIASPFQICSCPIQTTFSVTRPPNIGRPHLKYCITFSLNWSHDQSRAYDLLSLSLWLFIHSELS